MRVVTPSKCSLQNISFDHSPIKLHENPGSSPNNLTGLPRLIRDLVADIYNTIQKWNQCHIEGSSLVKQIFNYIANNKIRYTDELECLTRQLRNVILQISTHENTLQSLPSQFNNINELHGTIEPIFISLSLEQLSNLVRDISSAYKKELEVKKSVLENIAFSTNIDEAMFHATCWVQQPYVTNLISLKLEILLIETGHRRLEK